jgi:hypothetical protein
MPTTHVATHSGLRLHSLRLIAMKHSTCTAAAFLTHISMTSRGRSHCLPAVPSAGHRAIERGRRLLVRLSTGAPLLLLRVLATDSGTWTPTRNELSPLVVGLRIASLPVILREYNEASDAATLARPSLAEVHGTILAQ